MSYAIANQGNAAQGFFRTFWGPRAIAALLAVVLALAPSVGIARADDEAPLSEPVPEAGSPTGESPLLEQVPEETAVANPFPEIEPKTLKRTIDPVIVTGEELPRLVGREPADFAVVVWDAEAAVFATIPYQFDERRPNGKFVFNIGPDVEPDRDGGLFDENDELVFMAVDTGPRAPALARSALPPSSIELKVLDPVGGGKAWAYVVPKSFSPGASPRDYADLNADKLEIVAENYIYRYCQAAPITFDYLAIRHRGRTPQNIVDRLKIRASARLLRLFGVSVDEESLSSKLRGAFDGPVRAVWRSRNRYTIAFIPTMTADVEAVFYRDHFVFNMTGDMPFDADTFVSSANLRVAVDYTQDIEGARFFTATQPEGVELSSRATIRATPDGESGDHRIGETLFKWGAIYGFGPEKRDGWLSRMIPGPTVPDSFVPYVKYRPEEPDPPERIPGTRSVGFYSDRMKELKGGTFTIRSFLYRLEGFSVDEVDVYLNVTDRPLAVAAQKIANSEQAAVKAEEPTKAATD